MSRDAINIDEGFDSASGLNCESTSSISKRCISTLDSVIVINI